MSDQFGVVGKSVRLYEGFKAKRDSVHRQLREAGLTDGDLMGWGADMEGGHRQVSTALRESGGSILDDRREVLLQESGSTSDFGAYLSDKVGKRLMAGYDEPASSFRQYTRTVSVPDFKPLSFVRLTEMEDLLEIPEAGPYPDSKLGEIVGPTVQAKTFGRTFSLTRPAIINDDLNQLRERPAAMGRAVQRTMARSIIGLLESNPLAYDGNAVFSTAHKNLIAGLFDNTNVAKLITGLRIQTDDTGNRLGLRPTTLLVPPELELESQILINSLVVPMAGLVTDGRSVPITHGAGEYNAVSRSIRSAIVENYLTDPNDFYVLGDQQQAPGLAVGFLNGKEQPDIFLHDPGMRNVLGTSDPYSMHFDEIKYKARHDWAVSILDWRGLQKSAN